MVAASSLPAAAPLAFVCGALTPPLEPALRALWPDLAGDDEHALHAAYELDAGAQELIFVARPAAGRRRRRGRLAPRPRCT